MIKKAIIGLVAVAAIFGLRPVLRRTGHQMRKRCEEMAGQFAGRGAAAGSV